MFQIIKAEKGHLTELTEVARKSFLESHGHSASETDIQDYLERNLTILELEKELKNPDYIYRLILKDKRLIGYSKLILNVATSAILEEQIAKLERIYILQSELGSGLGKELFDFNVELARKNHQKGMWLFVWVENKRAFRFYQKMGFEIVGQHDFKISETHSNPNHQMFLRF